ncbi:hypothetical protein GCM10027063_39830 [Promicromonospora xylanilytica]
MNDQHTPASRTGIAKASVPDGPNPFAVHGDPSRHDDTTAADSSNARRVRWTRAADLHHDSKVTERLMRGVDLEARLIRWTISLPARGVRRLRNLGTPAPTPHRGVAHEGPVLS